jgi:NTP pyrophosphatase (non-canonical NTP hydrolase)
VASNGSDWSGDKVSSADEFAQLRQQLISFRDARDWKQFHNPKDLAISISVESSELLSLFQWKEVRAHGVEVDISEVSSEVADIFIYLMYFCLSLDIDLVAAAKSKLDLNEQRYSVSSSRGIAGKSGLTDGFR